MLAQFHDWIATRPAQALWYFTLLQFITRSSHLDLDFKDDEPINRFYVYEYCCLNYFTAVEGQNNLRMLKANTDIK